MADAASASAECAAERAVAEKMQKDLDEQRAALQRAEAALAQRAATPVSAGVVVLGEPAPAPVPMGTPTLPVGQPVAEVPMGKPVEPPPVAVAEVPTKQGGASSSSSSSAAAEPPEPAAPPPQLFSDDAYAAARARVFDDDHWRRLGLSSKVLLHGRFSKKHNDGAKLFGNFAAWKVRWVVLTDVDVCWYEQTIACPPVGVPAAASGPRGRFSLRAGGFGDYGAPPPALTVCGAGTIKLTAKRRTHEETLWLHTASTEKLEAWLKALSQRTHRVREDKPARRAPNPYDF